MDEDVPKNLVISLDRLFAHFVVEQLDNLKVMNCSLFGGVISVKM